MSEEPPNIPTEEGPLEQPALWRDKEVNVVGDVYQRRNKDYVRLDDGTEVEADEVEFVGSTGARPQEDEPQTESSAEAESQQQESSEPEQELTTEQQQARKAVIDYLSPRIAAIEKRKDNPRPDDDLMKAKLEALVTAANEGKFDSKVAYTGTDKEGKQTQETNSIDRYFRAAFRHAQEGSPPAEKAKAVLDALAGAGVDMPKPESKPNQKDEPPDSPEGNGEEPPTPEANKDIDESSWLDLRRIQDLKAKYEEILRRNGPDAMSQEFKDIAKTHVIESSIAKAVENAKYVKVGKVPQPPSEQTKQKMAQMLEWSWDKVNRLAERTDRNIANYKAPFRIGQEVKVVNSQGEADEGWKVEGFHNHKAAELVIIGKDGKDRRYVSPNALREWQERAESDPDKTALEKLKPYVENPAAKVKLPSGEVVNGEFRGYSTLKGKLYVADNDGKLLPNLIGVNEFLSWQGEQNLSDKMAPYIGKNVKIKMSDDSVSEKYKCVEYDESNKVAVIELEGGNLHDIPVNEFLEWQSLKSDEEKATEGTEAEEEDTAATVEAPAADGAEPKEKTDEEKLHRNQERLQAILESPTWFRRTMKKFENQPKAVQYTAMGIGGLTVWNVLAGPAAAGLVTFGAQSSFARLRKKYASYRLKNLQKKEK